MTEKLAIDNLVEFIRIKHLSVRTERQYRHYLVRYIRFIEKLPSGLSSEAKFERFLSSFAESDSAASTQNVAFNAVRFFYENVLRQPLQRVDALRAKREVTYRNAHPIQDILRMIAAVDDGQYPVRLVLTLLYERGLRLNEPLNLRLRDIDLAKRKFVIRGAKGGKYRVAPIPEHLASTIEVQMRFAESVWRRDLEAGIPIKLPHQIAKKYPSARFSRHWAWLFPQERPCKDPRTGETVRWHMLDETVQRGCRRACRKCGLDIKPHELRHSCATDLLDAGVPLPAVQKAFGHVSAETTAGYYHTDVLRVPSPVEILIHRQTTPAIPVIVLPSRNFDTKRLNYAASPNADISHSRD